MSDKLAELREIVGSSNVFNEPEVVEAYSKDKSFSKPMKPRWIVKVKNVEEVQELVKWANKTKTPLVPVSSGAPHYKGDTVPGVPGAVIVDLSDMKKIISINRQQRIAVVEPGVTYGELLEALAEEGLTISVPLAPKATKSVLASVLDIEPRLNSLHQWNFIDPLRCTEVVWGDGNRMYTGEAGAGAMDLDKQWGAEKWQVSGAGPMMLDFYRLLTGSQGTMGIVTWASLKCEVDTKVHKMFMVPAKKAEDLNDFLHRVIKLRFSNELFAVNGQYLAFLLGGSAEQVTGLIKELPAWIALIGVAGREILPEERVRGQAEDIEQIAQQFGLKMVTSLVSVNSDNILKKVINPSGATHWKETYKGSFEDIFFTTTLEETQKFIDKMYGLAEETGYPAKDIGVYIQPQHMGTCFHCEFTLPYDAENSKEVEKTKKLFIKASEEFSRMGAYYLRPHGIWSKLQLNKDAESYSLLKKLKAVFDPNDIMNTGKLSNN